MDGGCVACAGGFDHCHGTLVAHVDGRVECTEPDCDDVDSARHDLVIDCPALPGCCVRSSVVLLTA
jgi:hypothetical protein